MNAKVQDIVDESTSLEDAEVSSTESDAYKRQQNSMSLSARNKKFH